MTSTIPEIVVEFRYREERWSDAFNRMVHFLNAGVRIPAEAAIIAGWDDMFLHFTIPTLAHYRIDGEKAGRKTAGLLIDLLKHGLGKIRSVRILPEFVPGETL